MISTCSNATGVAKGLVDSLVGAIERGELKPGAKIGTELDLAKQYGISRNSVRRAISGLVADGVVNRRPGLGVFVGTPVSATRVIQVVLPGLADEVWVRFAEGAKQVGSQHGVSVQIYDAHGNVDADIDVVRNLPGSFAVGAIVFPLDHPRFTEALFELKRVNYPFVLVEGLWHGLQVSSVTADDYGGGKLVGDELVRLGHLRIAYIGPKGVTSSRCRLEGMRDAVGEAGLPFMPSLAVELDLPPLSDWSEPIMRATRQIMHLSPRPTAIFYSCDGAAAHGYNALRDMGLKIPRDVSVVGFDDEPLGRFLNPALSTVKPPSEQMGMTAMDMLLEQINGKSSAEVKIRHCDLPTKLMMRGSVAKVAIKNNKRRMVV